MHILFQAPTNNLTCSLRSVALIAGVLGMAGNRGQKRRHAAADNGVVTWSTPSDVAQFIKKDYKEKIAEMEKALGKEKDKDKTGIMAGALERVRDELRVD